MKKGEIGAQNQNWIIVAKIQQLKKTENNRPFIGWQIDLAFYHKIWSTLKQRGARVQTTNTQPRLLTLDPEIGGTITCNFNSKMI